MSFYLFIVVTVSIFVILSLSLNLILGLTGVVSVAHAAFMASGAYGYAVLTTRFAIDPILAVLVALAITASLAWAVATVTRPLAHETYILGSLALQVIATELLIRWEGLTGGMIGIGGIPRPSIGPLGMESVVTLTVVCVAVAAGFYLVARRLSRSAYGLVARSVREDPSVAASLGVEVERVQASVFVLGSTGAGVAGILYAWQLNYVSPEYFSFHLSLLVITLVAVGGLGNMTGALVGAVLLTVGPEMLKLLDLDPAHVFAYRELIYGMLIGVVVRWLPSGLIAERATPLGRARKPDAAPTQASEVMA